eukprot:g3804.t1
MTDTKVVEAENEVSKSLDLNIIRYSRVWEDHQSLTRGLEVKSDDVVLSIASSGDNALNLLLCNPKKVVAFDMSPAQIALVELKVAALQAFEKHCDFLWFLGMLSERPGNVTDTETRSSVYRSLIRNFLWTDKSLSYWDDRSHTMDQGVAHCGRLEKYFREYRETCRPSRELMQPIWEATTLEERKFAFNKAFTEDAIKKFKQYYGQSNQANNGRSDAQMRYVGEGETKSGVKRLGGINGQSIADFLWNRLESQLVGENAEKNLRKNPYIELFLFSDELTNIQNNAPPYLLPENYEKLRKLTAPSANRFELRTTTLEDLLTEMGSNSIDKYNLSDIFEYMSVEDTNKVFLLLYKCARDGARVAYWNLYLRREPAMDKSIAGNWKAIEEADLLWPDRCFQYSAFKVDCAIKE